MDMPVDQARALLMESNEEFRKLAAEHSNYDRRIEELTSRQFPSEEERAEEARLKRIKLSLKDQMYQMVRQLDSHVPA